MMDRHVSRPAGHAHVGLRGQRNKARANKQVHRCRWGDSYDPRRDVA
jgi:hypothetical protein